MKYIYKNIKVSFDYSIIPPGVSHGKESQCHCSRWPPDTLPHSDHTMQRSLYGVLLPWYWLLKARWNFSHWPVHLHWWHGISQSFEMFGGVHLFSTRSDRSHLQNHHFHQRSNSDRHAWNLPSSILQEAVKQGTGCQLHFSFYWDCR